MNDQLTLVIGGNGKTGRRLVQRLTAQDRPVRIGSRSGGVTSGRASGGNVATLPPRPSTSAGNATIPGHDRSRPTGRDT